MTVVALLSAMDSTTFTLLLVSMPIVDGAASLPAAPTKAAGAGAATENGAAGG